MDEWLVEFLDKSDIEDIYFYVSCSKDEILQNELIKKRTLENVCKRGTITDIIEFIRCLDCNFTKDEITIILDYVIQKSNDAREVENNFHIILRTFIEYKKDTSCIINAIKSLLECHISDDDEKKAIIYDAYKTIDEGEIKKVI